jgi:crossover junction endodeoxyribonuclease RuvC
MTIIIGIDPGLSHTGWGIIDVQGNAQRFVACGVISPKPAWAMADRLFYLHDELHKVIALHRPGEAAIEETFVNKSGSSTLKLANARGALLLSLAIAGLPVTEYAARLIKQSVTGSGRAEKEQVAMMVRILLLQAGVHKVDAMDALAIALTHAHHRHLAAQVKEKT